MPPTPTARPRPAPPRANIDRAAKPVAHPTPTRLAGGGMTAGGAARIPCIRAPSRSESDQNLSCQASVTHAKSLADTGRAGSGRMARRLHTIFSKGPNSGFASGQRRRFRVRARARNRAARRFFWAARPAMNARCRVLVIGNGMVGQRFLESLAADAPCSLTVLAEEPRPAYDRVQLSSFFSGKTADDLSLVDAGFFEKNGIALNLSERAIAIDREQRRVRTSRGRELDYDILVMATGSYPFVPAVTGRDRPHCHVYRTIEDLEAIRASSEGARAGAVIGGGLLGLEAAKALRDLGVETHVVEFAPRLMALQVDDGGGNMLRRKIEALGVHVHTGKNTREIIAGTDQRHRMSFADGGSLEVDLIVFSAGIRPRDELA